MNSQHLVQLFDDPESLAERASAFLLSGWSCDEPLLLVARPAHSAAIGRLLGAGGCSVTDDMSAGKLVVLDAASMLAAAVQNGRPVRERFFSTVGGVVADLAGPSGKPLRVYGEMVDILASHGDLAAAHQVEQLWNELGRAFPINLLCGYTSGNFGDPRTSGMLAEICAAHDRASAEPCDLLGAWLLSGRRGTGSATAN